MFVLWNLLGLEDFSEVPYSSSSVKRFLHGASKPIFAHWKWCFIVNNNLNCIVFFSFLTLLQSSRTLSANIFSITLCNSGTSQVREDIIPCDSHVVARPRNVISTVYIIIRQHNYWTEHIIGECAWVQMRRGESRSHNRRWISPHVNLTQCSDATHAVKVARCIVPLQISAHTYMHTYTHAHTWRDRSSYHKRQEKRHVFFTWRFL